MLPFALRFRPRHHILRLSGESHEDGPRARRQTPRAKISEDVRRPLQHEGHRVVTLGHLLRHALGRRVVGDRRREHRNIHRIGAREHGCVHLRRAADPDERLHGRRLDGRRSGDERDVRAAPHRFVGDGESHAPGRSIADVTDRIDVLVGRPRSDQHALAAQRAVGPQHRLSGRDDLVRLGEPALPDPSARQIPFARLDEPDAPRRERVEVPPHCLVREHLRVHGRRDHDRRPRSDVER